MAYFLCINLFIKDSQELTIAKAEGYVGAVTTEDIEWNGPLSKGDFMTLRGMGKELEVIKLVHYVAGQVGCFDTPFTSVHLETSKEVVDFLVSKYPETWQRLDY